MRTIAVNIFAAIILTFISFYFLGNKIHHELVLLEREMRKAVQANDYRTLSMLTEKAYEKTGFIYDMYILLLSFSGGEYYRKEALLATLLDSMAITMLMSITDEDSSEIDRLEPIFKKYLAAFSSLSSSREEEKKRVREACLTVEKIVPLVKARAFINENPDRTIEMLQEIPDTGPSGKPGDLLEYVRTAQLTAAYVSRANRSGSMTDLDRAISYCDRANSLNPSPEGEKMKSILLEIKNSGKISARGSSVHPPEKSSLTQELCNIKSGEYSPTPGENEFDSLIELGKKAGRKKDFDSAIQYFRKALSLRPESAEAFYWLGMAEMMAGQLQDAKKTLLKTLELDPKHASAKKYLEKIEKKLVTE